MGRLAAQKADTREHGEKVSRRQNSTRFRQCAAACHSPFNATPCMLGSRTLATLATCVVCRCRAAAVFHSRSNLHSFRLRRSRSNTSTEDSLPGATQLSQVRSFSLRVFGEGRKPHRSQRSAEALKCTRARRAERLGRAPAHGGCRVQGRGAATGAAECTGASARRSDGLA